MELVETRGWQRLLEISSNVFMHDDCSDSLPLIQCDASQLPEDSVMLERFQRILSCGVIGWMARSGWADDRVAAADGEVRSGRLWQRVPQTQRRLRFSPFVCSVFRALACRQPLVSGSSPFADCPPPRTSADRLVLARLLYWSRDTLLSETLIRQLPVTRVLFCLLVQPGRFPCELQQDDWEESLTLDAWILDALQDLLTGIWRQIWVRESCAESRDSLYVSASQSARQLIIQCAQRKRYDLLRFLLDSFASDSSRRAILTANSSSGFLPAVPEDTQRLADELRGCTEVCRSAGFYEEGYRAAQIWLDCWERMLGTRQQTR